MLALEGLIEGGWLALEGQQGWGGEEEEEEEEEEWRALGADDPFEPWPLWR